MDLGDGGGGGGSLKAIVIPPPNLISYLLYVMRQT